MIWLSLNLLRFIRSPSGLLCCPGNPYFSMVQFLGRVTPSVGRRSMVFESRLRDANPDRILMRDIRTHYFGTAERPPLLLIRSVVRLYWRMVLRSKARWPVRP